MNERSDQDQEKQAEAQAWKEEQEQRREREAEEAAENPYGVKTTERGEWQVGGAMDGNGFIEYRLDYGRSEAGHHYLVNYGDSQGDRLSRWSEPFLSTEAATSAANAAAAWVHESDDHQRWESRQIAEFEHQRAGDEDFSSASA